jgi:ATP-dependent RNA helicase RhlE
MKQQSFRALGVSAPVVEALAAHGKHEPFRIQSLVLPDALAGLDVLARSPTGSGKTLAFALAIAERLSPRDAGVRALVLVPTRELAAQVAEELAVVARPKQLRVCAVYGGAPLRAQAKQAAAAHVLIATPGRLEDLITRRLVSVDRVSILVLDEADRMLDMGFQPQVDKILARMPRERQTMFFSATLDGEVGRLAHLYTKSASKFEAELPQSATSAVTDHQFVAVTSQNKVETLVEQLGTTRSLALVFVRTKRGADRLARRLAQHGVAAAAMHGDMTQSARERTLARFAAGKVTTLVATDVAARGLDLPNITHVINFDPPEDEKAYVHRIGRTGRAGKSGTGITLVLPDQQNDVSLVAARVGRREEFERDGMTSGRAKLVYSGRRRRNSRW